MMLRFVIAIPTYNNPQTVAGVVRACLEHTSFPIVIVDDGSKIPVASLIDPHERIHVIRFEKNRGKGRALQAAFDYAIKKSWTHLISIDADGQHDAKDIKQLVAAAMQQPFAMTIGYREMDPQTTPGSSMFGRKFSNFWLWYQTDQRVTDSQSGFRIYPLFLVQNIRCFWARFAFELEILVRLFWRGVPFQMVNVGVRYFPLGQRVSHFHKFYDNARITLMNIAMIVWSLLRHHARPAQVFLGGVAGASVGVLAGKPMAAFALVVPLCFLLRVNGLLMWAAACLEIELARSLGHFFALLAVSLLGGSYWLMQSQRADRASWDGKMRGGLLGQYVIAAINRVLGQTVSYACMIFVVPYFVLFAPKATLSSMQMYCVLHPRASILTRFAFVFRHFFRFSSILLDRLYQSRFSEEKFQYGDVDSDLLRESMADPKGSVIVTAHFGALDMIARATGRVGMLERLVRAEFVAEGKENMEHVLKRRQRREEIPIISQSEQSILKFRELILAGKHLVMMGDRPLSNHLELVSFCGKLAIFDSTPYRIAQACQARVLFCFGTKEGMWAYNLHVAAPGQAGGARNEQIFSQVQSFAKTLENLLRTYPEQWANFFPFWSQRAKPPASASQIHEAVRTFVANPVG